jgi:hypothetical protein
MLSRVRAIVVIVCMSGCVHRVDMTRVTLRDPSDIAIEGSGSGSAIPQAEGPLETGLSEHDLEVRAQARAAYRAQHLRAVSALFRDAKLAGLIEQTQCELDDRQLGPVIDKDPTWRADSVFRRSEA